MLQDLIEKICYGETADLWECALGILLGIHIIVFLCRIISKGVAKRPLRGTFSSELAYLVLDAVLYFVLGFVFDKYIIEGKDDAIDSHVFLLPFLITCIDLAVRFLFVGIERRRHGQPFISNPVYLLVDAICYLLLAVYAFLTDKTSLADRIGVLLMFFFFIPLRVICIDLVIRFAVFCYRKIARRNKAGKVRCP